MKRLNPTLFLGCLVLSFTSNSQIDHTIGIQLGAGTTLWSNPGNGNGKNKIVVATPIAGINYQYNISEKIGLNPGLYFQQATIATKIIFTDEMGNILSEGGQYERNEQFTLPILAKLSLGQKTKFFIQAGPSLSLVFRQSVYFKGPYAELGNSTTATSTSKFRTGFTAGLGMNTPIGENLILSFEFRDNISEFPQSYSNNGVLTNYVHAFLGLNYKL